MPIHFSHEPLPMYFKINRLWAGEGSVKGRSIAHVQDHRCSRRREERRSHSSHEGGWIQISEHEQRRHLFVRQGQLRRGQRRTDWWQTHSTFYGGHSSKGSNRSATKRLYHGWPDQCNASGSGPCSSSAKIRRQGMEANRRECFEERRLALMK